MKSNSSFFKKNGLFIIIVLSIVLLIATFIGYQYVTNLNQNEIPVVSKPSKDKENEGKEVQFSSFDAIDSTNVIRVSWKLNDNDQKKRTLQLYANEQLIADVTGYSTWAINKAAYGFEKGKVDFKIVAIYEDGTELTSSTSLTLQTEITSSVKVEPKGNEYMISITYSTNDGTTLATPRIYIAGLSPDLFTVTPQETVVEGKQTIVSYLMKVDSSVKKGTILNGRFIFDDTGAVEDFEVVIGKE